MRFSVCVVFLSLFFTVLFLVAGCSSARGFSSLRMKCMSFSVLCLIFPSLFLVAAPTTFSELFVAIFFRSPLGQRAALASVPGRYQPSLLSFLLARSDLHLSFVARANRPGRRLAAPCIDFSLHSAGDRRQLRVPKAGLKEVRFFVTIGGRM